MRKCLLAVQGPLQFIAGLIALEWYGHVKHDSSDSEVVLLIYDLSVPTEVEKSLEEAILSLAAVRRWKSIVFVSAAEMSRMMRRRYPDSIDELRSAIGEPTFEEIAIMRDYSGAGSPLILNAYPDAVKITYGDSFGLVGNESELRFRWSWSLKSGRSLLKAIVRKVLLGSPKRFSFDAAVLTLPIDWSGSYLSEIQLLVPPRGFALAILKECGACLSELNSYCQILLDGAHDPYVILLSTLSDSQLMSSEDEIDLYVSLIRQTVPRGSTVFLKPHPRGEINVLTSVMKRIGSEYSFQVIDDSRFSRLPIELWRLLIEECRIVAVYSTCCLNLNYFYGKEVILPLNESNIRQYVYPKRIASVVKGNAMNLESLNRLKEWDGKSPVWRAAADGL